MLFFRRKEVLCVDQEVFARRLKQLRAQKGVSQEKMSLELNLTQNYIFNIESGYAYPSMANFFGICSYFGITPEEFFTFGENPDNKAQELLAVTRNFCGEDMDHLIDYAIKMKW